MKSLKNIFGSHDKRSSVKSDTPRGAAEFPFVATGKSLPENSSHRLFHEKHIDEKTILHVFSHIIAQEYGIKGKVGIMPVLYKNNTVFVDFKNSLWAQEVWINRGRIIGQVNDRLNKRIVYKIKAH